METIQSTSKLYKKTNKTWNFEFDTSNSFALMELLRNILPKKLDELLTESRFLEGRWDKKKRFRIKMKIMLLERIPISLKKGIGN